MHNKLGIVIAARTGSSRLPEKALKQLCGLPMVILLIRRLQTSKLCNNIIFATTDLKEDNILEELVSNENIPVYRGSKTDLVCRYLTVAELYDLKYIVRITGDCPFVDGASLDYFLTTASDFREHDLVTTKPNFPRGIDFELFKTDSLMELHSKNKLSIEDREHLTKYFYDNATDFSIKYLNPPFSWKHSKCEYTIDYPEDYIKALNITSKMSDPYFTVDELMEQNYE